MPMPPIQRIAEVVFETDDLDRSVHFYSEVLGLPLETRDERTAWFRWGDQLVAFFDKSLVGTGVGNYPHTTFEVSEDDLPDAITALEEQGVEHAPPRTFQDGAVGVYFADPNGNMIELYARPRA
jgi:catechol 2,3-dioxygenase-like lactoylglutathione lyase family enzyme